MQQSLVSTGNHFGNARQRLNEAPDNKDGIVTLADYEFWKLHYGETLGSGAGQLSANSPAAPEPATLALPSIALLGIARFRRRRRV